MKQISFTAVLIISVIVIFNDTGISQEKPDGFLIKTSFPENPIVSIKNDEYNPDAEFIEKKYVTSQNTAQNKNPLNKATFDIDAFQTIVHNGNELYIGNCIVTERTGSTAGTIWAVAGVRSSSSTDDWLGIFKFGQSGWTLQTAVFTLQYLSYSIDAELIEKDTGEKTLWIVVEARQTFNAKREVYYAGINLANFFEKATGKLSWPGAGPQDNYYNARITTDNFDFPDNPKIFIVASLDSITSTNKHVYAQKFAFITSPHDLANMQINYRTNILPVYWPDGGTTENHYLYSDIAYYNISGGLGQARLIFTYSNVPDDTKIWLSRSTAFGNNAQFIGTIEGNGNYRINTSAIASTGGGLSQQLMVVFEENYQNSGDWDIVSARSNDAGSSWYLNYIDGYPSNTDKLPRLGSVVSRKGVEDEYYVSYSSDKPGGFIDSIMSIKSNSGTTNYWDQKVRMDGIYSITSDYSSVGITNTPDERVTVWSSEAGGSNFKLIGSFWPTFPSAVDDETDGNVDSYQLYQNYPNPFNPTTRIEYRVASSEYVTLKVYDLLGREVATLVNDEMDAGKYSVEFDASDLATGVYLYRLIAGNFVSNKKMILIK